MAIWKSNNNQITFSDIMRGLQHSVSVANQIVETHFLDSISTYFDDKGSPKTKRIKLNNDTEINIPLISLIALQPLEVAEIEIEFKTKLSTLNAKSVKNHGDIEINRASFSATLGGEGKKNDVVDVRVKYTSGNSPEGYLKVMDEINNLINTEKMGN